MDSNLENSNQSFNAADTTLTKETTKTSEGASSTALASGENTGQPEDAETATNQQAAVKPVKGSQQATEAAAADPANTAKPVGELAETTGEAQPQEAAATAAPATKPQKGLLASFFGAGKPSSAQSQSQTKVASLESSSAGSDDSSNDTSKPTATPAAKQFLENPAPKLAFENAGLENDKPSRVAARRNQAPVIQTANASAFADDGEGTGLPGVRQSALFEIKRKSGVDDDSDVDVHEDVDGGGEVDVATAGGMARLAPNGLLKQRESVDVACLKPSLVRVLKTIERHYGKKLVVTSGYRSPSYNRSVRGAKNSQHMYCAAADIQVPGVSKWELANFAKSMPGRGGVGTYCHTNSVHVDVGPEREWNWRCRGRS